VTKGRLNSATHRYAATKRLETPHFPYEYILSHFGQEDAQQIQLEEDPQVTKALKVLPHAREVKKFSQKAASPKTYHQ
jgi:hypothetical protein